MLTDNILVNRPGLSQPIKRGSGQTHNTPFVLQVCDTPFTVKHFLLECRDFAEKRHSCFQVNNSKHLFKDVSPWEN